MATEDKTYQVHPCKDGCGLYINAETMSMCSCCYQKVVLRIQEQTEIGESKKSELQNDQRDETKLFESVPNTSQSEEIASQTAKRDRSKMFDINKLKEMVAKIVQFKKGKIDLRLCFWSIGKLSGGITVDGEIWNKYCNDQQSKKDSQDRLPFRKLFHIKNIFDDPQIFSLITREEFERLEDDLGHLKDKMVRILTSEHCDNMEHVTESVSTGSISNIIELSDKYFEMLTAKLIKTEIFIWESIEQLQKRPVDFNIKDDRYFIARLLCKIGELLNELTDGLDGSKQGKSSKDYILRAFKNLIKIRNRFLHDCEVIVEGIKDQNGVNTELLATILDHMRELFCQPSRDPGHLSINYQYANATKFETDSDKLLKYFSGKLSSLEDCKRSLDEFIMTASTSFKEFERKIEDIKVLAKEIKKERNKMKNKLDNINKQYQAKLKEMKEADVSDYPTVINLENKDTIIKKAEILENDPKDSKDKKKVKSKDYIHLRKIELEYFRSMLNEEHVLKMNLAYTSFMLGHVVPFAEYMRESFKAIDAIHDGEDDMWEISLCKLAKYQSEMNAEFEAKFPDLFSEFKRCDDGLDDGIQNTLRKMLGQILVDGIKFDSSVFSKVTEDFHRELFLFVYKCAETELRRFPELKKYDYILQQIVLHNLQLIIDSGKLDPMHGIMKADAGDQENHHNVSVYRQKYVASRYMNKGMQLSKGYRSKGLAHNLLFFNIKVFYDDAIDDSLNLSKYLQCLNVILNSSKLSSVPDLCDAADAFCSLSLHSESLDLWKKTLELTESHAEEIEQHEFDQYYMKIFRKPRLVCNILQHIFYLQSLLERYEDMYQKLEAIVNVINLDDLGNCDILEIRHCVNYCYLNYAECLRRRGNATSAVEYFEKADRICEDFATKYNLAITYYDSKQYDRARDTCRYILDSDAGADWKMLAMSLLIVCDSDNPNPVDSKDGKTSYIGEMENLLLRNKRYFKNKLLGNNRVWELSVLDSKLEVIISKCSKQEMDGNDLKELIEIDKTFHGIKEEIDVVGIYENLIAGFYLRLCESYCLFFNEGKIVLDDPGQYLKLANQYFNIAFEKEQSHFENGKNVGGELSVYCNECANCLISACHNYVVRFTGLVDLGFLTDFLSDIQFKYPDLSDNLIQTSVSYLNAGNVSDDELFHHFILLDLQAESRAINDGNLQQLKCSLSVNYTLSSLFLQKKLIDVIKLRLRQKRLGSFLCNLSRVLVNILSLETAPIECSPQIICYCRNKWKMEISHQDRNLQWKYEGNLSVVELMKSIKSELSSLGELMVIYIFTMGYYKEDDI